MKELRGFSNVALRDVDRLPNISAIYFVVSMGRVLYVGQSVHLHSRWNDGHHKMVELIKYPACRIYWTSPQSRETMAKEEQDWIRKLNPPLNHGAEIRRARHPWAVFHIAMAIMSVGVLSALLDMFSGTWIIYIGFALYIGAYWAREEAQKERRKK